MRVQHIFDKQVVQMKLSAVSSFQACEPSSLQSVQLMHPTLSSFSLAALPEATLLSWSCSVQCKSSGYFYPCLVSRNETFWIRVSVTAAAGTDDPQLLCCSEELGVCFSRGQHTVTLNNCVCLDLYSDSVTPTLQYSPDRVNLGNNEGFVRNPGFAYVLVVEFPGFE